MPQRRPRSRFTLDYNATSRLQIGLEYNTLVDEEDFRGSWVILTETGSRPQIHLNTSSDRIGTPEGKQQVSLTFAKSIPRMGLAPYASLTYSGFEDRLVYPFGLSYHIDKSWSALAMNDGRKSHLLLNYSAERYFVQAGWIWFKNPAITVGWGF